MHVVPVHGDEGERLTLAESRPRRRALPLEFGGRPGDAHRVRDTIELILAVDVIREHGQRHKWPLPRVEAEIERLLGPWAKGRGLSIAPTTLRRYEKRVDQYAAEFDANIDRRGRRGRPAGPGVSADALLMFDELLRRPNPPTEREAFAQVARAAKRCGWKWYTLARTAVAARGRYCSGRGAKLARGASA